MIRCVFLKSDMPHKFNCVTAKNSPQSSPQANQKAVHHLSPAKGVSSVLCRLAMCCSFIYFTSLSWFCKMSRSAFCILFGEGCWTLSPAKCTCGSSLDTAKGGTFKVDVLIFIPTGGLEARVVFFTLWLV